MARVLIVDDTDIVRKALELAVRKMGHDTESTSDAFVALELACARPPDLALLDYRMPGMDGAEVAAAVTRDELPTRVLLVSAHDESAIVYKALQEGAAGFLPKESTRSELVSAVLKCAKGKDVLAPELAAGLASEIRRRNEPDVPALSPREREVLKMIAAGSSIPAMAKEMFLAPSTVKTHVQRLYEKLGVSDRAAAVAEAMRRKLLD
jgi:two-component system nitrate/nitrite response regulator NarL